MSTGNFPAREREPMRPDPLFGLKGQNRTARQELPGHELSNTPHAESVQPATGSTPNVPFVVFDFIALQEIAELVLKRDSRVLDLLAAKIVDGLAAL